MAWLVLSLLLAAVIYFRTRVRLNREGKLADNATSLTPAAIQQYAQKQKGIAAKRCLKKFRFLLEYAQGTKTYWLGPDRRKIYSFQFDIHVVSLYVWAKVMDILRDDCEQKRVLQAALPTLRALPRFAGKSNIALESRLRCACGEFQGKSGEASFLFLAAPACEDSLYGIGDVKVNIFWRMASIIYIRALRRYALASVSAADLRPRDTGGEFSVINLRDYI